MNLTELRAEFDRVITEARRCDLSPEQRRRLVDFLEREVRMILEPLADHDDAWANLGFRRAAR